MNVPLTRSTVVAVNALVMDVQGMMSEHGVLQGEPMQLLDPTQSTLQDYLVLRAAVQLNLRMVTAAFAEQGGPTAKTTLLSPLKSGDDASLPPPPPPPPLLLPPTHHHCY